MVGKYKESRAEVSHSGKKPHPQKGTGKSAPRLSRSPQYKGGGRVHAPRPKFDQHVRINRKEKRAASSAIFSSKKFWITDYMFLDFDRMKAPKDQTVVEFY